MSSDLERQQLIKALEKLLALFDGDVESEYSGTTLLKEQLARADFARRALKRVNKQAQENEILIMTDKLISEDDFHNIWQPQLAPSGDLLEYDDVKNQPLTQVWTIVDTDENNWYACPGFHIVNKLGYVTTIKHWDDDTTDAVYYEYEGDDDDDA